MGKESPDNYEPSAEDLAKAEQLFRDIGSENVLSDAENLDIEHGRKNVERELLGELRRQMLERLFDTSDLLAQTPDFPQKKALRDTLSAACSLLLTVYSTDEGRARAARNALDSALSGLAEFDPKAKQGEETQP